jgi:adenine-specific DNA-methyltransferase
MISQISTQTSGGSTGEFLSNVIDTVLWFARDRNKLKYRALHLVKQVGGDGADKYNRLRLPDLSGRTITTNEKQGDDQLPSGARVYRQDNLTSQSVGRDKGEGAASWFPVNIQGKEIRPNIRVRWKTNEVGMTRLLQAARVELTGASLSYVRFLDDFGAMPLSNAWNDIGGVQSRADPKIYVVQTPTTVIQRCILMTTDPGDLVLDPTCGSGTTAYVAEQWGRRWITIDTSRVSLALARSRLMGARYPYYLLADSPEGQRKEAEVRRSAPKTAPTNGRLRLGFVYERVPHITLKSIANNAEIDVIWEEAQKRLEPLRATLNTALKTTWQEWEIPREAKDDWPKEAKQAHAAWWQARIARQKEIDASIAARADVEYLFDKPYEDKSRIRVAGPFTVESLSPHRTLAVDWDDELIDPNKPKKGLAEGQERLPQDFASMILENLRSAGVQQARKEDRIIFTSLKGWPGDFLCAEGRFMEGTQERRAGILIGPEFGTLTRPDLVAAAREAGDAGFDILVACAFAYDAHSAEFDKLGRLTVLKARMNPDLHMAKDLKATGHGNLFVVFGEPDIQIEKLPDGMLRVAIKGVDVFKPQTGEVVSEGRDGIALWMLDTDYNEESFFVRHAYFLGANDPYKALKTTLKAEIDEEAWSTLNSDVSRPFAKPASGRIAVKVINHLGDEVMKVFAVG